LTLKKRGKKIKTPSIKKVGDERSPKKGLKTEREGHSYQLKREALLQND